MSKTILQVVGELILLAESIAKGGGGPNMYNLILYYKYKFNHIYIQISIQCFIIGNIKQLGGTLLHALLACGSSSQFLFSLSAVVECHYLFRERLI